MPTGYTAPINDGISFEDFVMRCSRAFGALIPMRDEPMDAPIPERFEPFDWAAKALVAAREELARIDQITLQDAEESMRLERKEAVTRNVERVEKYTRLETAYNAMIERVKAWEPPTPGHEGLKTFMLEQLSESLKCDCRLPSYQEPIYEGSPERWLAEKTRVAREKVEQREEEHRKEIERTEGRNQWLADLRASLRG